MVDNVNPIPPNLTNGILDESNQGDSNKKDKQGSSDLEIAFKEGVKQVFNIIPNFFGKGEAKSLDGSTRRFNEKKERLEDMAKMIEAFSMRGGNKTLLEYQDDSEFLEYIKNIDKLDTLKASNIDGSEPDKLQLLLEDSLKKDLAIYIAESEEELRKRNSKLATISTEKAENLIDSTEKKNIDAVKYRIMATILFFGILDCLDIASHVLDNFGGDFADSVGRVLRDPNVMGGFSEINKAFGVDKIFEGLSKIPILHDINQFWVDAFSTELLQPFGTIAQSVIQSEVSGIALKSAVLAYQFSSEIGLYKDYAKAQKQTKNIIDDLEHDLTKSSDDIIENVAKEIVKKQEYFRLDTIYLRDFLKSEEIETIDNALKSKLLEAKIKDEKKQEKSAYQWLKDIFDPNNHSKKNDLEKFIVLLSSPENAEALKLVSEVAKKSQGSTQDVIEEKQKILEKFVTDSNYEEIKSLIEKSEQERPEFLRVNFPQNCSRDQFCNLILQSEPRDCDRIIVEIAKNVRVPEVVLNLKNKLSQSRSSGEEEVESYREKVVNRRASTPTAQSISI